MNAKPSIRDVMSAFARERFGLHEDWQWSRAEAGTGEPDCDVPKGMNRLRGAAYEALKGGKRKGSPNYKKPIQGTESTVFYLWEEFRAWEKDREQRLGICKECLGTGEQWASSGPEGTKYKPCTRCKAKDRGRQ